MVNPKIVLEWLKQEKCVPLEKGQERHLEESNICNGP